MTRLPEPYSFSAEFAAQLPKKRYERLAPPRGQPAGDEAMGAAVSIATHPPLGQVTQLGRLDAGGEIVFWAMLETEKTTEAVWQVAVWHNGAGAADKGNNWVETPMTPAADGGKGTFWPLQESDPAVAQRHYYRTVVAARPDGAPLQFTVKFRAATGPSPAAWRWVSEEPPQKMDDGVVLFEVGGENNDNDNDNAPPQPLWPSWLGGKEQKNPEQPRPRDLSLRDLVHGLNEDAFRLASPRSQAPGTQLWALQTTVPAADTARDRSSRTSIPIGFPWGARLLRWMALVRIWTPWLGPRHGRGTLDLDGLPAVLGAFLGSEGGNGGGGRHLVFLPVSGVGAVQSVLGCGPDGQLLLDVRCDSLEAETATVLVAMGDSFESANAAVLYHARGLVSQMHTAGGAPDAIHQASEALGGGGGGGGVHPQWMESWYDGLGYCTWNGIGQDLSEDKIVAALDTLTEHGIQVASLIIDDNWQSIDRSGNGQFQYGWERFEADAQQFPHGLAHAVARVRAAHPHIQHIAVWHALLGYWGGVSADGAIAGAYETTVVERAHPRRRNLPVAGPMTVVAGADAVQRLYDDFYRFLAAAGVDGVKTDAQFMTDTWVSAAARRQLAPAYTDAWALATLRHLGGRGIACMAQTPAILFHAQLPTNRPAVLARNSDDFFPNEPAAHPWHVWANAHNSLLAQHLNVLPDWDMFQTVHAYSAFHAAARCVSGGPLYITDVPGQHDLGLLAQMTGQTLPGRAGDGGGGKTVVFRPSVVGRSLDPYVGFHDGVLLKVGAYHGNASTGAGLVGVFNVSDHRIRELLPLARVPGVEAADDDDEKTRFVARAHTSGRVTAAPLRAADALLPLSLDVGQYEILTVYRAMGFAWTPDDAGPGPGTEQMLYVANLGLVEKMAAAATVVSTSCVRRPGRRLEMNISLKAPGVLGLYVSAAMRGAADKDDENSSRSIVVASHFLVTMRGEVIPQHCVRVAPQDAHVLEIDTARAWREMGFAPLWTNEVQVTIYIVW